MLAEKGQRLALSNSSVVPYFHPENSPLFTVRLYNSQKIFVFFFFFSHCRHSDKDWLMFFRPSCRNKVQLYSVSLLVPSRTGLRLSQRKVPKSNKSYKEIVRYLYKKKRQIFN